MFGLQKLGAMADPGTSLVQILVFSALIVAVDPVAVSVQWIHKLYGFIWVTRVE